MLVKNESLSGKLTSSVLKVLSDSASVSCGTERVFVCTVAVSLSLGRGGDGTEMLSQCWSRRLRRL